MPDPLLTLAAAVALGGILSLLFWPEGGLFWRWQHGRRMTERVLIEDALKQLYESHATGGTLSIPELAAVLRIPDHRVNALLAQMKSRQLLTGDADRVALTTEGTEYALYIIRAHRLWERYLAEKTGFTPSEWHQRAHEREHRLSSADLDELASQLDNPTHDPHGDPIPDADGRMGSQDQRLLTDLTAGELGRIVHLEDEPAVVYAQLTAEGLAPGMAIRVLESSPQRIRFWADGDEHVLAPALATSISVVRTAEGLAPQQAGPRERLTALQPGERAVVAGIAPGCRGPERRRFLDLGILPGTCIEATLASPSGNPIAYRVRGALIALRHEQASHIQISRTEEVPA